MIARSNLQIAHDLLCHSNSEAERILSANVPTEHSSKRKVINPSLGELIACMGQVDEFRNIRAQFMTQRLSEGASMQQAERESKEITEKNIKKAKELRSERAKRKEKVLEKIDSKLPKSEDPEVRARLIQAYLNEHGSEIIAESEQYTLGEIKAEIDLNGSVKGKKAKSFLANYAEAEETLEGYEGDLRNAAKELYRIGSKAADTFDRLVIPGYSAWADGGNAVEVITSAGSDIVLTLVGGKVIKVAWTGTKALYSGAKALGRALTPGKVTFEIAANKVPYNPRAMESLLAKDGAKVTSSTLPKSNAKNVKLAGSGKELIIGVDEITGQPITKRIAFNERGLPIFDDVSFCDLKLPSSISSIKDRRIHFKEATSQLKSLIERGIINKRSFSVEQLADINKCKTEITGFTWHHHEDIGRMQLVPREIHKATGHSGGFDLWYK